MAVSKSKLAANKRYDDKAYDRISVLLPKGTKELIQASGVSINGFINEAIKEKLERLK